jgi:calcineurin-like phosphoesterase
MTGAIESVLGMDIQPVVERFTTKLPRRFTAAKGKGMVNAVFMDLTSKTIQRIDAR